MNTKSYISGKRVYRKVICNVVAGIIGLSTIAIPWVAKADLAFDLCVADYLHTMQQRIDALQFLESISPSRDTSILELLLRQNHRKRAIELCQNSVFGNQQDQYEVYDGANQQVFPIFE